MNLHDDAKAFVDGELSEPQAREMESAMASDADLREEIDAMKALGFELKRVAVDHPSRGAEKAMERFRKRPWTPKIVLGYVGIAGMIVIALASVRSMSFAQARGPVVLRQPVVFDHKHNQSGENDRFTIMDGATVTSEARGRLPAESPDSGVKGTVVGGAVAQGLDDDTGLVLNGLNAQNRSFADGGRVSRHGAVGTLPVTTVSKPAASPIDDALRPQLIRTASLSVKVESAQGAMHEAMSIANRFHGFYESSHHAVGQNQTATADITLRVPVKLFDRALDDLRKLGEVKEDASDSEDVTAQVADVGARLKVKRAEEESYVTMLRAGRRVGEILEIKDRLSTVREDIEGMTAQLKALKNQSTYSTIACTFMQRPKVDEPAAPSGWTSEAWANAVNGLAGVGRFLGQAAIFLFVYAPIWIPGLLVLWWLKRRFVDSFPKS